jgi:alpha-ketoglutarate-dependent taurine dioxygenase
MHVRNFGTGFGLSWQTVFQTSDKEEVERYCLQAGIRYEWGDEERLQIRQVRPAVAQHPRTGEWLWFNHATFFHVSTLEPTIRERMLAEFRSEDLPNNTYYVDGSEIEASVMDELREAYLRELVQFTWERGDVLMLDNMLTAHARRPFVGERKILVAMAEPFRGGE